MKLLMHLCCSNCALYPLKSLLSRDIGVKGFWFNPNIHPHPEYQNRLDSLQRLERLWGFDIEYHDRYRPDEFLRTIGDPRDNRCIRCYGMRLEETARTARAMGLDGFTTSLLVSPYQQFDEIVRVGVEMARKHSIPFLYEDFRIGYKDSIPLSRELGLYRQKYCGCLYSERERQERKKKNFTAEIAEAAETTEENL